MHFASGNFQAVSVELVGIVQGCLFQSPPYSPYLLSGAFRYATGFDFRCLTSFFTAFVTA